MKRSRFARLLGVIGMASCLVACTKVAPVKAPISESAGELNPSIRRALMAEGLEVATEDAQAGLVVSDWVVETSTDDFMSIYRVVVEVDDPTTPSEATVRSEWQKCPPFSTVFDRCQPINVRIVAKPHQAKLDSIAARLSS